MISVDRRSEILRAFGADEQSAAELLHYNTNHFEMPADGGRRYPLEDEPFVAAWEAYAAQSASDGVFECLKARLPQLNFPIVEGISQTEEYKAATRRGTPVDQMAGATGLRLRRPEELRLIIHATAAGRIPLLITPERSDFVDLVRALTMRNEPGQVPVSMGACIVAGYNNWDRVASYRAEWTAKNSGGDWSVEFQRVIPRKELYQDRFILLSREFYSSVRPDAVALGEEEWREKSVIIRREHECTHYFTRRVFGSMRNHWLDEIIADYSGIVAAAGRFRADWLLNFAGLEEYPRYRAGARLENYRGDPPLSDSAFRVLQGIAKAAAESLERFWDLHGEALQDAAAHPFVITALSLFTLEEMADRDAADQIWRNVEPRLSQAVHTA